MSIHDKHLLDLEMTKLPMRPNNSQDEDDGDQGAAHLHGYERLDLRLDLVPGEDRRAVDLPQWREDI